MVVDLDIFTGPRQAGDEPLKSNVIAFPAMRIFNSNLSELSTMPSLSNQSAASYTPSGNPPIYDCINLFARVRSSDIAPITISSPYSSNSSFIRFRPRSKAFI